MPKLNIYKLKDLPYISIDVEDKKTLYTAIMYNQLTLSRLSHENGDLIFSFLPAVFGREFLQSRECVV